jgi:hypothetical protein
MVGVMLGMGTSWSVTEIFGWTCAAFIVLMLEIILRSDLGGIIGAESDVSGVCGSNFGE